MTFVRRFEVDIVGLKVSYNDDQHIFCRRCDLQSISATFYEKLFLRFHFASNNIFVNKKLFIKCW